MEIWGNLPQKYLEAQGVLKVASAPPPVNLASSGNILIASVIWMVRIIIAIIADYPGGYKPWWERRDEETRRQADL